MNFLIVGLGSMGKRRIRCLKALGYNDIFGFDCREDRRVESEKKYAIKTYSDFSLALNKVKPSALIISVPPDIHLKYIKIAIKSKIHFFVEASVVDIDMNIIKQNLKQIDIVAAPSATLLFHPAIQEIWKTIKAGKLGKISNILLHSGQYLPDWHIYEKVSDFYVSNPITGGAREIVPYELTWVTKLFGFPQRVCGNFKKTISIKGAESIDDTYNFLLDYRNFLATITVDVVSRHATRRLLINGEKKQLVWDWDVDCIKIYNPESLKWNDIPYKMNSAKKGYNPNIGENMYIDEIKYFIESINSKHSFINTIENDHKVLKLLYAIEKSDKTSKFVKFEK